MKRRQHIQHEKAQEVRSVKHFFAFKITMFVLFIALLASNVIVFAQSVRLSDEIVDMETHTLDLQKENARLEQEVYTQNSLTNLQELADQLGFTKTAEPIYLESNEFASLQ